MRGAFEAGERYRLRAIARGYDGDKELRQEYLNCVRYNREKYPVLASAYTTRREAFAVGSGARLEPPPLPRAYPPVRTWK
jgi:hypothetical protein